MLSSGRSAGGPDASAGLTAGWTAGQVRGLVGLLAVLQVLQGVFDRVPTGNVQFTESYYLVTYHHGFVRRGLLGEGLRLVFGVPTRGEVDVTADIIVALAVAAVLVTAELLIRKGTASSYAMAVLVVATPFTIDFVIIDRRPDLLALVALVALGIVLLEVSRSLLAWLAVFGLGFAALVLVHEDVILVQVPWSLVLVTVATLGRDGVAAGGTRPGLARTLAARLGVLVGPPLVATAALLAYGLPSTGRVGALESDVGRYHFAGNTVFTYLPDSIGTAVSQVAAIPDSAKATTLVLGLVLFALQGAWSARWVRPRLWATFARRGNRALGTGLAALIVATTALLFATGFDWVRWFADCGASWLVVLAFAVLLDGSVRAHGDPPVPTPERTGGVHLSRWLPALAVYLAVIPPLDVLFVTGQLRHFLLGV
jgi:hypothetical protein